MNVNVNVIGMAEYSDMCGMREIEKSVAGTVFTDVMSKAAVRLEMEETNFTKCVTKISCGDEMDRVSESEDKYCSLCGSMIKEDGSCPLCGVPIFISGNGKSANNGMAYEINTQAVTKSNKVKIGRKAVK